MTRSCGWAGLAVILLGSVAAPPAAAQRTAVDTVTDVLTAFAAFTQDKNVAGLDTLMAPDSWVQIIEGAGMDQGWVDYRDHHLVPELAEFASFRYRYLAIEPQVRGAVAWAPFRYELAADTPGGHAEVEGRGTAVLERRDGRWVIVHLHTSGRRKPAN
jgi:ketosteroid isomerase-like protein